jgi:parallel beta-helix repeat protein
VLTANIGGAGPCIVIKAQNIGLNLNGHSVLGTTGGGSGIVVAAAATGATVLNGNVDHWGTGIDDIGKNARLMKLRLKNNSIAILLAGAASATVTNNTFPGNTTASVVANKANSAMITQNVSTGDVHYGIWLKSSSGDTVANNRLSQNGIAAIFVGCTAGGIKNVLTCTPSTHDVIAGNRLVYSIRLGIAIDRGNTYIQVHNNTVSSSGTFDLFESNPACGTNSWKADTFSTHNRACAK